MEIITKLLDTTEEEIHEVVAWRASKKVARAKIVMYIAFNENRMATILCVESDDPSDLKEFIELIKTFVGSRGCVNLSATVCVGKKII